MYLCDRCKIGTPGTITPPNPNPGSWTYGSEIPCRYEQVDPPIEVPVGGGGVEIANARIRLLSDASVNHRSRIQLTSMKKATGVAKPVERYFAVVGAPKFGLRVITCNCKRISETGSAL